MRQWSWGRRRTKICDDQRSELVRVQESNNFDSRNMRTIDPADVGDGAKGGPLKKASWKAWKGTV